MSTSCRGAIRVPVSRSAASTCGPGGNPTRAGASLLVVAEVLESPAQLADVLTALDADEHTLVRLQADPATLRARIIEREPDAWFGLEHLLGEMERLAAGTPSLGAVHLVFDTTYSSAVQIAAAIRSARSDVLMSPPPVG
jgi:hypothetical protein